MSNIRHITHGEIDKLIDRLNITNTENLSAIFSQDIRIAVIQLLRKEYSSLADYIIDMNLYISDAVNRRAQLVCFPAYTGLLPATIFIPYRSIISSLRYDPATDLPDIERTNDLLSQYSDSIFDVYMHVMESFARKYKIYIITGSTLYFDEDELLHRAFLLNDRGDLIGFQDKISLNKLEKELEIEPASELKVFETKAGNLAILIAEDADYFEPARIAKNLKAQILVNPTVFINERTTVDMAIGINMRAQENFMFAAQSTLVGDTHMGFTTEGAACIFSPNEFLIRKNGVSAQTSARLEPDVVCARLNLDNLAAGSIYTRDKNPELLRRYIDRLY